MKQPGSRHRSSFLLIAAFVAGSFGDATGQTIYETYTGWAVSTEPVLPPAEIRPSLWFVEDEIPEIRARRHGDDYAALLWNRIVPEINAYKNANPAILNSSRRPLMAKALAFAWIMDQDEAALEKAIEALLIAYDNVPRGESENDFAGDYRMIYRAPWLQNYCAAYDWVQPELTAEQDSIIRSKLIHEAQVIRNNLVDGIRYAPRPHNHRSKPAWALASAALTFAEHDQAADWLEHALEQSNTVTRYMFSHDGVYREGGHYHIYNAVNLIPFLWHYRNVSGVDLFEDFRPGFEWPVRIRTNKGWMPNIEDSYIKPFPTHMVAAAYENTPTDLHSSEPLSKILQWNWNNTQVFDRNYSGATNDVIWEIDEYVTYDPAIQSEQPDANPTMQMESGQVIFRNKWNFDDPEGRYMLFNGVAEADNHQHPDLTSYFLESHNTLLAIDAGYGRQGFGDQHRPWYVSAEAHNLVTINNAGPADWSTNSGPTDLHFINTPFFAFSEKLARTGAPNGTIRRGIAFPNQQYWVVYDIGAASLTANYRLNIHSRGSLDAHEDRATWSQWSDRYGSAARLHTYVQGLDSEATLEEMQGWTSLFWGHQERRNYVQMLHQADSTVFLHLLWPSGPEEEFPPVTDLTEGTLLSFEVATDSTRSQFTAQKTHTLGTSGAITTDALFSWGEHDESGLKRMALNEGREFRWNGRPIVDFEFPVTLAAELVDGTLSYLLIEEIEQPTNVVLWAAEGMQFNEILLNGAPVDYQLLAGGGASFTLTEAGELMFATVVGLEDEAASRPALIAIAGNHPNPFSDFTRLTYEVPEAGHITIRIYNALGQTVRVLVDEFSPAGTFTNTWNVRSEGGAVVSSGLYIFEITSGEHTDRKTGLVIR